MKAFNAASVHVNASNATQDIQTEDDDEETSIVNEILVLG